MLSRQFLLLGGLFLISALIILVSPSIISQSSSPSSSSELSDNDNSHHQPSSSSPSRNEKHVSSIKLRDNKKKENKRRQKKLQQQKEENEKLEEEQDEDVETEEEEDALVLDGFSKKDVSEKNNINQDDEDIDLGEGDDDQDQGGDDDDEEDDDKSSDDDADDTKRRRRRQRKEEQLFTVNMDEGDDSDEDGENNKKRNNNATPAPNTGDWIPGVLSPEHFSYTPPTSLSSSSSSSSSFRSSSSSFSASSPKYRFYIISYLDDKHTTQGLLYAAISRLCYAKLYNNYHIKLYTQKDIARYFPERKKHWTDKKYEESQQFFKYWSKNLLMVKCLRELAADRSRSWCVWMDSDMVITNPKRLSLDHIFDRTISRWRTRYMRRLTPKQRAWVLARKPSSSSSSSTKKKKPSSDLYGDEGGVNSLIPHLFVSSSHTFINNGFYAMRNTTFCHHFLHQWRKSRAKLPFYYDNAPFVYTLFVKQIEGRGVNSYKDECSVANIKAAEKKKEQDERKREEEEEAEEEEKEVEEEKEEKEQEDEGSSKTKSNSNEKKNKNTPVPRWRKFKEEMQKVSSNLQSIDAEGRAASLAAKKKLQQQIDRNNNNRQKKKKKKEAKEKKKPHLYHRFYDCAMNVFRKKVFRFPEFRFPNNLRRIAGNDSDPIQRAYKEDLEKAYEDQWRVRMQHEFQICPKWDEADPAAFEDTDSFYLAKGYKTSNFTSVILPKSKKNSNNNNSTSKNSTSSNNSSSSSTSSKKIFTSKNQPRYFQQHYFNAFLLADDRYIVGDCRVNSIMANIFQTQYFNAETSLGAHTAGVRPQKKRSEVLSDHFLRYVDRFGEGKCSYPAPIIKKK